MPKNRVSMRGEIDEVLADSEEVDLVALARERASDMLDVLSHAALGQDSDGKAVKKIPWNVRTRSAKDVIEIAEGRPATKDVARTDTGITIIVQNLFADRNSQTVSIPVDLGPEVPLAREAATLTVDELEIVSKPLISRGDSECTKITADRSSKEALAASIPPQSDAKSP